MKLTGESLIAADRHTVWAALSDPAVRARCVGAAATPGGGESAPRIAAGRQAFSGGVAMTEARAPGHCVLASADGQASAEITLAAADEATRLTYVVTAATDADDARARTEMFFARLKAEAEGAPAAAAVPADVRPAVHHAATDTTQLHGNQTASGLTPLVWGGLIVLIVLGVLVWQLSS